MGPWRPSSVPETCRPKNRETSVRVCPGRPRGAERGGFDARAATQFSLAPRLRGRPSLQLHLRTRRYLLRSSWAGAGPGPVQGAGTLLTGCRAPTPSQRRARRQRRQQGRQLRRQLPRSSARSRSGYECCCCGWPRPPPLSPYRTRSPTVPGSPPRRLQPRCSLRCVRGKVRPAADRGGPGRKCAGRRRPTSGGRGRGAGPVGPRRRPSLLSRSLRGHQAQAPPLTARPSSSRCTYGHRLRQARRPPPPTEPASERSHSQAPPPPSAEQAPPQAPPPVPRRPHPDSTRHSSSVGPGLLRP